MTINPRDEAEHVMRAVSIIHPIFMRMPIHSRGAALADLLALWLAGFPDHARHEALQTLLNSTGALVGINEHERFGPDGHMFNRENRAQAMHIRIITSNEARDP